MSKPAGLWITCVNSQSLELQKKKHVICIVELRDNPEDIFINSINNEKLYQSYEKIIDSQVNINWKEDPYFSLFQGKRIYISRKEWTEKDAFDLVSELTSYIRKQSY